jgi:hypothetical protein
MDAGRNLGLAGFRVLILSDSVPDVMADELKRNPFQVTLAERHQEVETLPPNLSHQLLAVGIRLGRADWGFQDSHARALQGLVESQGENPIAVVNDESIGMIERQE